MMKGMANDVSVGHVDGEVECAIHLKLSLGQ